MSKNKKLFWSFFLILTIALIPTIALGQSEIKKSYTNYFEPIANSLNGESIIVAEDEIIEDNFFRYGENVQIKGNVMGDVIIAASKKLTIDGDVEGDVIAAADTIIINGQVKGNIRIVAADLTINNKVGKNATIAAGQATFTDNAEIGWTLSFVADNIDISSPINGSVYGYGGEVNINTTVGNNVTLFLDGLGQLNLLEKTKIGGKLEYRGEKNAEIDDAVIIKGDTIHKLIPESVTNARDFLSRFWIYGKFISLFSLLLIGTLIISIFIKTSDKIVKELPINPAQKMLWGLLFLIATPIFLVLLAITIIGAPLSLIGFGIYALLNYISTIFIGLYIGDKILNYKKDEPANPVWTMMLGTLIFIILKNIPYIGWAFGFIGTIWFLGTISVLIMSIKKTKLNQKVTQTK
ncbi:MAG: polymer-forming cytoskeletal protein [bacterium]|nr:polymer-forming cytoskeletal protein [bacterium]